MFPLFSVPCKLPSQADSLDLVQKVGHVQSICSLWSELFEMPLAVLVYSTITPSTITWRVVSSIYMVSNSPLVFKGAENARAVFMTCPIQNTGTRLIFWKVCSWGTEYLASGKRCHQFQSFTPSGILTGSGSVLGSHSTLLSFVVRHFVSLPPNLIC